MSTRDALTVEQIALRDAIADLASDVRVLAHPGTGKTHAVLRSLKDGVSTLLLEYNRSLRLKETNRARSLKLLNVEISSYDHVLFNYYDRDCAVDFQLSLREVLRTDKSPVKRLSFERLVIDEMQDMTVDFRSFVYKLLKDNIRRKEVQLVCVGDPKQCIYDYRGASPAFLLEGIREERNCRELLLTRTFRCSTSVCAFANKICGPLFHKDVWGTDIEPAPDASEGWCEVWEVEGELIEGQTPKVDALLTRIRTLATEDRKRKAASGNRKDETSVGLIGASTREDCALLWSVAERVRDEGESTLHAGKEDENAEAADISVQTVHCTKGTTQRNSFVFFEEPHLWLDKNGVMPGKECVLFVACTRPREGLAIVQHCNSRIFDRIWEAKAPSFSITVRSAHDGSILRSCPGECAVTSRSFTRKTLSLSEIVESKLHVEDKEHLLQTLPPLPVSASPQTEELCLAGHLAITSRLEYEISGKCERLASIIRWANGPRGDVGSMRDAYDMLCSKRKRHFANSFQPMFEMFRMQVQDWKWREWLAAVGFLPELHHGHAWEPEALKSVEAVEKAYNRVKGLCTDIKCVQGRVRVDAFDREMTVLPYGAPCFVKQSTEQPILLVFGRSMPLKPDVLLALAASWLLSSGGNRVIENVQGDVVCVDSGKTHEVRATKQFVDELTMRLLRLFTKRQKSSAFTLRK